jgi:parvulin-like peptidyl-prolyl isomerase
MEDNKESKKTDVDYTNEEIEEIADEPKEESPKAEGSAINDLLHILGISHSTKKETVIDQKDNILDEKKSDNEVSIHNNTDFIKSDENQIPSKTIFIKPIIITLLFVIVLFGSINVIKSILEPNPPAKDVVGSYNGKNITIKELLDFIPIEGAKEQQHGICEKHGFDHSKCDQLEECEAHPIDSLEGYRQLVRMMAVEQIVMDWANAKGITQREDVQHGIKDLFDDANVDQLVNQIHETEITPESIPKWEVQKYYDDNKEIYGDKTMSEVEAEIRNTLVTQKDEEYFPEYIEKLKESSGLKVDFDLLQVTEPTEEEVEAYYQDNIKEYQTTRSAEILEIRITSNDAQSIADEIVVKLGSGEEFESVAEVYAEDGKANTIKIQEDGSGSAIEEIAFNMSINEVSDPIINEDGTVSIIKLLSISEEGELPLSEVKSEIRAILLLDNTEKEYSLRKDEALFSVHSRRYTLGDFYREFLELSVDHQKEFSTFEAKKLLVEQLIAKELLLEETSDSSASNENNHEFKELKIQYLSQILHQEEVDNQIADSTEEEMVQFYDKNKSDFVIPASVKLSIIWLGLTDENAEAARKRADEALSLIRNGTDFSEVAKQYSEDGTAENGGIIEEWIYMDHLPESLGDEVFPMKVGDISDVIENAEGLFIIKVREREEEIQQTFEETKDMIREYLYEEKHLEMESKMEETLLADADFIIYDKTLKKLLKEKKPSSDDENN